MPEITYAGNSRTIFKTIMVSTEVCVQDCLEIRTRNARIYIISDSRLLENPN